MLVLTVGIVNYQCSIPPFLSSGYGFKSTYSSNSVNQMLLRNGFTNLHFGGVVVTDLLFHTVIMAQTELFTTGKNSIGHVQKRTLHWSSHPALLNKKIKNKNCGNGPVVG